MERITTIILAVFAWLAPVEADDLSWQLKDGTKILLTETDKEKRLVSSSGRLLARLGSKEIIDQVATNEEKTTIIFKFKDVSGPRRIDGAVITSYTYSRLLWFRASETLEGKEILSKNSDFMRDLKDKDSYMLKIKSVSKDGMQISASWFTPSGVRQRSLEIFPPKFRD